jgi:hypothetical protein
MSLSNLYADSANEVNLIKIYTVDKKERYIIVSEEDLKDFNELEKIIVKIGKKNASIRNPSGLRDSAIKTIVSWKTKDNESCLLLFDINGNLLTYSQSIIEDKEAIKLSTKLLLFIALSQSNHDIGTDGMDRGHR